VSADRRFLTVGLAVAGAEAALGALALPSAVGPYLLATAAATAALAALARRLLVPPPPEQGEGGSGVAPDDPPPPPWWPEFEAAFDAYARERRPDRLPG